MLFSFAWSGFKYKIQALLSEGRLESAQLLHVIEILSNMDTMDTKMDTKLCQM